MIRSDPRVLALRRDSRVVTAARIAAAFHIDPVTVLSADDFVWRVRLACAHVIDDDVREATKS